MPRPSVVAAPKKRPYFRKKSEWARHRSHELSDQAQRLSTEPVTSAREAGRRREAVANLQAEAGRFANMARRYEEQGR